MRKLAEKERQCPACDESFSIQVRGAGGGQKKYCPRCQYIQVICAHCGRLFSRERTVYEIQRRNGIMEICCSPGCGAKRAWVRRQEESKEQRPQNTDTDTSRKRRKEQCLSDRKQWDIEDEHRLQERLQALAAAIIAAEKEQRTQNTEQREGSEAKNKIQSFIEPAGEIMRYPCVSVSETEWAAIAARLNDPAYRQLARLRS